MLRALVPLTLALAVCTAAAQTKPSMNWYKGQLHAHTINSDGDSIPFEVMAWYKRNGYQFLAISDHNTYTDPAAIDTNSNDTFLLIGAEEVTNEYALHVNAIGIKQSIPAPYPPPPVVAPHVPAPSSSTITELLQASIDAIRTQSAIPLINHPNLRWAFTAKEMLSLKGAVLLEIASGATGTNHYGDGRTPSTEEMWDELLSSGMRIFGVAVDDAHTFRQEFGLEQASPGRGWVVARAPALTSENILASLNNGNFYASSGVTLVDVASDADSLTIEIQPGATGQRGSETRFRVLFIGKGGRVLATSNENPARYKFSGDEGYVRARVEDSRGRRAWTQPVFLPTRR